MKKLALVAIIASLFLVGCSGDNDKSVGNINPPQETEVQEQENVAMTYEEAKTLVDRNVSGTFKGENHFIDVTDSDEDGKYEISIGLDAKDNRFTEINWCAYEGLSQVDSIKKYRPELDEKVSTYSIFFFSEGSQKCITVIDNNSDIDSINLVLSETGETATITREEANAFFDTVKNTYTQVETPKVENSNSVPTEYKSALRKAEIYSNNMNMSKAGIYDQLTSEYGEKFSAEAAQYAIDTIQADWKGNALKKAKTYQESMAMSPSAIYDQLISEYGEKFTAEEAQYAIDNLD